MITLLKARVLCVDDEPGVARAIRWLLEEKYEVVTANSGHEALTLVKQQEFEVVMSDQRMPGMTGTELLTRVREIQPNAMRLLLTGYSDYAAAVDSVNESEVFRFIPKPWNNQDLLHIVSEAADIAMSHRMQLHDVQEPSIAEIERADVAARDDTLCILVVDEDPATADEVSAVADPGIEVVWVKSSNAALAMLDSKSVCAMVVDTRIGAASSLELVSLTKRVHPAVAGIVYTRETDAVAIRRFINEGQIFRFVTKPAGRIYLGMVMRRAVARSQALRRSSAVAARQTITDLLKDDGHRHAVSQPFDIQRARPQLREMPPVRQSWLRKVKDSFWPPLS